MILNVLDGDLPGESPNVSIFPRQQSNDDDDDRPTNNEDDDDYETSPSIPEDDMHCTYYNVIPGSSGESDQATVYSEMVGQVSEVPLPCFCYYHPIAFNNADGDDDA